MDAAWAAVAAVAVTQVSNYLVQRYTSGRAEQAAEDARIHASREAERQRVHELATRKLDLDAAAAEKLRNERVAAYAELGRQAWRLAIIGGVRQFTPRPGEPPPTWLDPSPEERQVRDDQVAITQVALWPVLHLGSEEVGHAARELVDYLTNFVYLGTLQHVVLEKTTAFNDAVRRELAGNVQ